MQSNCVFPIKHIRSLALLDWILESPQQDCHKTIRTLMSPQARKIDWCTPNHHPPFLESDWNLYFLPRVTVFKVYSTLERLKETQDFWRASILHVFLYGIFYIWIVFSQECRNMSSHICNFANKLKELSECKLKKRMIFLIFTGITQFVYIHVCVFICLALSLRKRHWKKAILKMKGKNPIKKRSFTTYHVFLKALYTEYIKWSYNSVKDEESNFTI